MSDTWYRDPAILPPYEDMLGQLWSFDGVLLNGRPGAALEAAVKFSVPISSITFTYPDIESMPEAQRDFMVELDSVAREVKELAGHAACTGYSFSAPVLTCGCGKELIRSR